MARSSRPVGPKRRELEALVAERTLALEEANARFRLLLDAVAEAVLLHDSGGTVLLTNAAAQERLERSEEELRGSSLRRLFVDEDADKAMAAARLAVQQGAASFDGTCITPSGRHVRLAVRCRAVDLDGRRVVLGVAGEIGGERSVAARAELMRTVAHDLRNPLAVVIGYSEMLREMGGLGSEREEVLVRLLANARRALSVLSNYHELVRIEAHRPLIDSGRADLNLVLQQVVDVSRDEARCKQIEIELGLDDSLPVLRGDAAALERAFANLVDNALRHTPPNGRVTLTSERAEDAALARVGDTGSGMQPGEVEKIFERRHGAGAGQARSRPGLGLFIAKALVEAHGGSISVDSAPGRGSVFVVRLPLQG